MADFRSFPRMYSRQKTEQKDHKVRHATGRWGELQGPCLSSALEAGLPHARPTAGVNVGKFVVFGRWSIVGTVQADSIGAGALFAALLVLLLVLLDLLCIALALFE